VGETARSVFLAGDEGAHPGGSKFHVSMFGGEHNAFFNEAGSLTCEGAVVLTKPSAQVCRGRGAFTVLAHRQQVAAFGPGRPFASGDPLVGLFRVRRRRSVCGSVLLVKEANVVSKFLSHVRR
jgi:hypothetical protein